MRIAQLLIVESNNRDVAIHDLQLVIQHYQHMVDKWKATAIRYKTDADEIKQKRGEDSPGYKDMIARIKRTKVDETKNQRVLDFLQTLFNLIDERSSDGDQEALAFYKLNLPKDPWQPKGPPSQVPNTVLAFLGLQYV